MLTRLGLDTAPSRPRVAPRIHPAYAYARALDERTARDTARWAPLRARVAAGAPIPDWRTWSIDELR